MQGNLVALAQDYGVHRWCDQRHAHKQGRPLLCSVTARCVDPNKVEVKHCGAVSFDGEHPKYAAGGMRGMM